MNCVGMRRFEKTTIRESKSYSGKYSDTSVRSGRFEEQGVPKGRGWSVAIFGFSICFVVFLLPLVSGNGEPRWDANRQFYPAFVYQADTYANGQFPLWDPYTNRGYPFHAEPQYPTLNPASRDRCKISV